jgi:hypothetical protein
LAGKGNEDDGVAEVMVGVDDGGIIGCSWAWLIFATSSFIVRITIASLSEDAGLFPDCECGVAGEIFKGVGGRGPVNFGWVEISAMRMKE